jgi:hypothetical protein
MYHTPERLSRHRTLYHALLSGKAIEAGVSKLPLYVLEGGQPLQTDARGAPHEVRVLQEQLGFYQNSRAVFLAIKTQQYLSARAPWAIKIARKAVGAARRVRRRLRS